MRIETAAVRHCGVIVTGLHHGECLRKLPRDRIKVYDEQGFLTDTGEFVNRVVGFDIAMAAGQLENGYSRYGCLYSEDLRR